MEGFKIEETMLNKEKCYCPADGMLRVEFRKDTGLPSELWHMGKDIDEDDFSPADMCIDMDKDYATINYLGNDAFHILAVCANPADILKFYTDNATTDNLIATFSKWREESQKDNVCSNVKSDTSTSYRGLGDMCWDSKLGKVNNTATN